MIKLEDLRFGMEVFFYKPSGKDDSAKESDLAVNKLLSGRVRCIQEFQHKHGIGIYVITDDRTRGITGSKEPYNFDHKKAFSTRKDALLWLANNLEERSKAMIMERNKALMEAQQ